MTDPDTIALLEAQAKRIVFLEALLSQTNEGYAECIATREDYRARIAELEASIDANDEWAEGFIEKTDAHIEKLKAALKPFAAVCDVWEDGKTSDNAERYFTLRVADLRAARAAYLGEKG